MIKTASCITMEEDSYMLDFIYNILVVGFFILNIKVILVNCKRETSIVTLKERILYELILEVALLGKIIFGKLIGEFITLDIGLFVLWGFIIMSNMKMYKKRKEEEQKDVQEKNTFWKKDLQDLKQTAIDVEYCEIDE